MSFADLVTRVPVTSVMLVTFMGKRSNAGGENGRLHANGSVITYGMYVMVMGGLVMNVLVMVGSKVSPLLPVVVRQQEG